MPGYLLLSVLVIIAAVFFSQDTFTTVYCDRLKTKYSNWNICERHFLYIVYNTVFFVHVENVKGVKTEFMKSFLFSVLGHACDFLASLTYLKLAVFCQFIKDVNPVTRWRLLRCLLFLCCTALLSKRWPGLGFNTKRGTCFSQGLKNLSFPMQASIYFDSFCNIHMNLPAARGCYIQDVGKCII